MLLTKTYRRVRVKRSPNRLIARLFYTRITVVIALLGMFIALGYNTYTSFFPMFTGGTLALNGMIDYGKGLGGKPYPVFKNFYAGGMGTVRGYESSSLGPVERDWEGDREYLGGAKRVVGNIELQFPMPGMGVDITLRWFTFLDGGNVFSDEDQFDFGDLRYSAGFGVSWVSPLGPLKLSYGIPLNAKDGDRKEAFQFQLGVSNMRSHKPVSRRRRMRR